MNKSLYMIVTRCMHRMRHEIHIDRNAMANTMKTITIERDRNELTLKV